MENVNYHKNLLYIYIFCSCHFFFIFQYNFILTYDTRFFGKFTLTQNIINELTTLPNLKYL